MAKTKCPDCPHDLHEDHDQWIGCRHQKRAASGKLVVCPCTRVTKVVASVENKE